MYELTHHCFGKTDILVDFDRFPTAKQLKKTVIDYLGLDDNRIDTLLQNHTLTLAVGEWLEINEVSHDVI